MHRYRISLETSEDVRNFVGIVTRINKNVHVVDGKNDLRVSGSSILGVMYAKMEWSKLYAVCDEPIYEQIAQFVVED